MHYYPWNAVSVYLKIKHQKFSVAHIEAQSVFLECRKLYMWNGVAIVLSFFFFSNLLAITVMKQNAYFLLLHFRCKLSRKYGLCITFFFLILSADRLVIRICAKKNSSLAKHLVMWCCQQLPFTSESRFWSLIYGVHVKEKDWESSMILTL